MRTLTVGSAERPLLVHVFDTAAQAGDALAGRVMRKLTHKDPSRPFLLGLPTGSTPLPFFQSLGNEIRDLDPAARSAVLDRLQIVVMDDFIYLETGQNIASDDPWSAVRFMLDNLLGPLAKIADGRTSAVDRILYPTPYNVDALCRRIVGQGGIDMQIMATDPFDGHVAQNYPDEPYRKSEDAKLAPLGPGFLKHHPWASRYRGVTFDLHDFSSMVTANPSGSFELVITGEAKRGTLLRFLNARRHEAALPVSFLWGHTDRTTLYTDLDPDILL